MRTETPRLDTGLRHALHLAVGLLLGVGVLRTWQQAPTLADGRGRAILVSCLGAAFVGIYVAGLVREKRSGMWARVLWITLLVALWVVGSALSEGFLWIAFPLYFAVLHVIPGWRGVVAVGSMVCWSLVAAYARARLDFPGAPSLTAMPVGVWLGPLLGALTAVFAYVVFGQLRRDADRHRALVAELRTAQAELAATERTAGMLAERQRLAREIHDTIAQGLGSIVMMARTARGDHPADHALELIESTARENLTDARRFVRDLAGTAPSVEDALRTLAHDVTARAAGAGEDLAVEFREEGDPQPLPQDLIDALHRGAQASLANVLQHADARHCVLTLTWWPDRVTLDIADDGAGFDPARPFGDESFGISGLRSRLAAVGGTVTIDSAPGDGTTVALSVPR